MLQAIVAHFGRRLGCALTPENAGLPRSVLAFTLARVRSSTDSALR